jgi:DNA polymerase-1
VVKLLLIDGDELLHRNLVALEEETDWGDQVWTIHVNEAAGRRVVKERLEELQGLFEPKRTVVAFSGHNNFRRYILPTYKSNRYGQRKPILFAKLKLEFMAQEWPAEGVMRPNIEADDVLGILATKPGNEDHVVVSVDKDFNGVPCRRWVSLDALSVGITEAQADRFHLYQTLTGDKADGYSGCPKMGPATAEKVLAKSPTWATVVQAYRAQGLSEGDALIQARVARILRWSDWDQEAQEPILWSPSQPCLVSRHSP